MSLPREGYEAQIARSERWERVADRDRLSAMLRTACELILSVAVGFACIAAAAHTADEALGQTLFNIGRLAWISGVLITLLAAYRRGERRGDW